MSSSSYRKGYRFEHNDIEPVLKTLGEVRRAPQSGAYTGAADFELFLSDFSRWTFSCKVRGKNPSKFITDQCEQTDFALWRWDGFVVPFFAGPFPKVIEFGRRLIKQEAE